MDTKYSTDDEGCMGPLILEIALTLGVTGMTRSESFVLAIEFVAQLHSEAANARDKE